MIFEIQELSFALGPFLLEGFAAFAARCACSALLALAGWLVQKWLHSRFFPRIRQINWRPAALPILLEGFARPLEKLALYTGVYLALAALPWGSVPAGAFFLKLYKIAVILLLTWGFYNASGLTGLLLASSSEEIRSNQTLRSVLDKVYKVIVVVFGVLMAAQELGLPVTGVITGAGLAGLTVSLAAQDTASNLFGGLIILAERPFQIGDWIVVGDVEGTVEDISFRSTRVRALDNSVYILTNSNVCSSTINNCAQRQKRLYRFTLGVSYEATRPQLEKLMAELRTMLAASPYTYEDSVTVQLTGFGSSSIDLLVSAYLRTAVLNEFLQMQSELNLDLMDKVKENGLDFAFPSMSVYMQKSAGE